VWVAEAGGTGRTEFGPAQSVILHSVISTLQDGPRTETWLGVVPYADFDRITLSAPMIHTGQGDSTWWAPTFSVPRDAGQGCLAGGFAMMITQGHGYRVGAPPGRDPAWPGTGVLIDRENRRCDDRVGSALWNGEFYAITVSGPSAGARWLAGRWASSPTRSAILADATGGAIPTAATRLGTGYAAAWIEPDREAAHVRVQRFTREGERTGPVIEVARVSRVQAEGLAIASPSAHEIDVAYPTDGGPALTRVEVGE
jgi:hypothetical protein